MNQERSTELGSVHEATITIIDISIQYRRDKERAEPGILQQYYHYPSCYCHHCHLLGNAGGGGGWLQAISTCFLNISIKNCFQLKA